jgi:hypothetical protein
VNSSDVETDRASGLIPVVMEKNCWDLVRFVLAFIGRGSGWDRFVTVRVVGEEADITRDVEVLVVGAAFLVMNNG